MERILLASKSPRRLELLMGAGFQAVTENPEIDESVFDRLPVRARVVALAKAKAEAVRERGELARGERTRSLPRLVLAADTIVAIGRRNFGKPSSRRHAFEMLSALSGRTHEVCTGSCLLDLAGGREAARLSRSRVRFRRLEAREIERYLDSGEWEGVAGAYRIQERAALFATRITGSYSGIVGLSLSDFYDMLRELGVS